MRWRLLCTLRALLILGKPGAEFAQLRVVSEKHENVVRLLRKDVEACRAPEHPPAQARQG